MNTFKKLGSLLVAILAVLAFSNVLPVAFSQNGSLTAGSKAALPAVGARQNLGEPSELVKVVSKDVPESELLVTEQFWTLEEMLGAKPLPLPMLPDDLIAAEGVEKTPTGPMEMIPGGPPDPESTALAKKLFPEDWADLNASDIRVDYGEVEPMGYSYPPPFTRYPVNAYGAMWKYYPWKTMGKLYFRIPNTSGTWVCSGAVAVGRAVWTTGHCVYTPGKGWHTNMVFVPAYRAGSQPYGQFTVFSKASLEGWTKGGNHAYDIGMVAVSDKSGHKISWWTGYLGLMWNSSSIQHFHAFAYPSNIGNAKYLITCAASTSSRDSISGPDPVGMGCDMGPGSSGGPWLVKYSPYQAGAVNYVNGVVCYYKADKPEEFFSPYFSTAAKNLYDWGEGK